MKNHYDRIAAGMLSPVRKNHDEVICRVVAEEEGPAEITQGNRNSNETKKQRTKGKAGSLDDDVVGFLRNARSTNSFWYMYSSGQALEYWR